MNIIKEQINVFKNEKLRPVITVSLIAMAIMAIILLPIQGKSGMQGIKMNGTKNGVVILEKDNLKLAFSRVDEEAYEYVKSAPNIMMKNGEPLVSPYLQMSSKYGMKFLMLRGITDKFYKIKGKTFSVVEGRIPQNKYEIMIGARVSKRLKEDFLVDDSIELENKKWKIVGIFDVQNDPVVSGALIRLEDFRSVSPRRTYSYIELKADDPKNVPVIVKYLNDLFTMFHDEFPDAPLVMAMGEKDYYSELSKVFRLNVMAERVTAYVLIAIAFVFILNMAHMSSRKRSEDLINRKEKKGGLFVLILCEVLFLSLAGGLLGAFLARSFNGKAFTLQLATVFLQIDLSVFVQGIIFGLILGIASHIPLLIKPLIIKKS